MNEKQTVGSVGSNYSDDLWDRYWHICLCACRTEPMALIWTSYQRGTMDSPGEGLSSLYWMMALRKIIQISRGITYVL